jgi:hypothetical protein
MRDREAESRVARSVPPPELRQFTDPSRPGHQGPDLGVNVYQDREAWLAARQEWAQANGMTVVEWFDTLLEETQDAGCNLDELHVAFTVYLVEEDDWTDPRLAPA